LSEDLVIDASVAVRWLIPSPDHDRAVALQDLVRERRIQTWAPALQRAEVGNALWKYVRAGRLTAAEAGGSFHAYLAQAPLFHDTESIAEKALQIAVAHGRSVYDCTYLALSLELQCGLVTADRKFYQAMRDTFPSLRLL